MMNRRRRTALLVVALAAICCSAPATAGAELPELGVSGNKLTAGGAPTALHGVNRSGTEYACAQGWGLSDGPTSPGSIAAMTRWGINAVRVPLNESCWLGIGGVKPQYAGPAYQAAIAAYVASLHAAGLYVVLDLHWAAPGGARALGQIPMADADHAPEFWRSVATTFRDDHAVVFDLYNEPFGRAVTWDCWRAGCDIPGGRGDGTPYPTYRAAGMQELVDAVRSTGATQPLMLGGLDYSGDVSGWLAAKPVDPLDRLVAAEHNYGKLGPCRRACRTAVAQTAAAVPVVIGEVGQTDCRSGYTKKFMGFADRLGISYLAWSWNKVGHGLTCKNGPALLENYRGKPTSYGRGVRQHLRAVAG
jgi:endoglucanase